MENSSAGENVTFAINSTSQFGSGMPETFLKLLDSMKEQTKLPPLGRYYMAFFMQEEAVAPQQTEN